jgi:hypothetical protein
MTQTTPDASFGPVLVAAVHPVAYIVNRTYETLVSNKNSRRKKKNTCLGPKRLVWSCLGPFSLRRLLIEPIKH